jgi:hypothetical protein
VYSARISFIALIWNKEETIFSVFELIMSSIVNAIEELFLVKLGIAAMLLPTSFKFVLDIALEVV